MKLKEEWVQEALANYYRERGYDVRREVEIPVGYIDLLVYKDKEKRLIEVKETRSIKHAIGQLLSYKEYHKDANVLEIVHFDYAGKHKSIDASYSNSEVVKKFNIKITSIQDYLNTEDILRCRQDTQSSEETSASLTTWIEDLHQVSILMQERQQEYHLEQERLIGKW